ncbi:MAG TPA: multidrug ABC transporter ATP-binding protein, partial [Planctomycetaceae bacterium]|nr:multidrug ABC transporter ATP-binding protein [Planctomycetaceae bacterium]
EIVSNHASVDTVELVDDQIIVSLHEDETDYSVLAQLLVEAGHGILLFQEESVNLEKAFMMLTKGTGVNF